MKYAPDHPLAPQSGIVAVCRLVLYEKIGPGEHRCNWCDKAIRWLPGEGLHPDAIVADHLNWDTSNDSPDNLVASCNLCNRHRDPQRRGPRIQEGELTMIWGGKRTRAVKRECAACGTEFLTIPAQVKIGRGRFCSRDCGYEARRKQAAT